jgi:helicase
VRLENLDIPSHLKQKYLDKGITDLNPPQRQAMEKGLMEGEDMVVASPTASGKTLIAEMAAIQRTVKEGEKTVYIVPLKALASEKFQDFSERFEDQNVQISVGDLDDSGGGFETADIVVVTSEKLDSLLRHNPSWIHEIGLVVVDEIHLLTSPNRGPTLEVTLTRLRDLLDFQLLGLSATISNSEELAEWLDSELVESSYRPVDLRHGILQQDEIEFIPDDYTPESNGNTPSGFQKGSEIEQEDSDTEKVSVNNGYGKAVLNVAEDTLQKDKQAIIFCNSRKGAEKNSDRLTNLTEPDLSRDEKEELEDYADRIRNVLGSPTSQCKRLAKNVRKGAAFHHAGLLGEQRNLVEEAFKKGLIRTVSATPTLAAGVNLPAYRVIIRDIKRYTGDGMDFIPVLEYEQMTGRAGRPEYDDHGEAITLAKKPGMRDKILERYILGTAEHIQSKLAVEPVLRMHTLSLVASGYCTSMEGLLEFYAKTFYAHQFQDIGSVEAKIRGVVQTLRDYDFIQENVLEATKLGRRVSELYVDPESAHLMLECLRKAEKRDDEKVRPISYLFMLARTTEMQPLLRVSKNETEEMQKALLDVQKYVLETIPDEWDPEYDKFLQVMKTSMMMQGWISEVEEEDLMDEYGVAPGAVRAKMRNADWLVYAAKELARLDELDQDSELEKLRLRLKHGIREELLKLVNYDQIGRVRARKLHDNGVRDQEDIREVSFEKLKKLIGNRTARNLKKQVGEENIFDRENITDYF